MENGQVPLWARPAVTAVEQSLAARGISASSIGRDSLFNAIIQAAMPIATADASYKQDANKTNYTAKVNAIMSDVSTKNAALQFNATTENQAEQFRVQMQAQVDEQNASRQDALSQFNANLETQVSLENASQQNAMIQFSANLDNQRDQFNATMSAQIAQANVQWRRQMNTANTAGANAVNQANAQNAFNLSNQALTNLWQEFRDEAQWYFLADESTKDRRAQLEASVLARESSTADEIGTFLGTLDIDKDDIVDGVSAAWDWGQNLFN
jgi:hypothetical protein